MQQERNPIQPPKEFRMFRDVPMQAIADLLKTLPIPNHHHATPGRTEVVS